MSDQESGGFSSWESGLGAPPIPEVLPPPESALAVSSDEDREEKAAKAAFQLADLASVLRVLRIVRLYERRETRQLALDALADMGLGPEPLPAGAALRYGMYRPSAAEQLLADYAAAGAS